MRRNRSSEALHRGPDASSLQLAPNSGAASSRTSWLLLQAALDSLSAHVAVLDTRGIIVAVNRQWIKFGRQNGLNSPKHGIGTDYVTALPQTEHMAQLRGQFADVLSGRAIGFRHSYWCDTPDGARFYEMQVRRYGRAAWRRILVAHEDKTELKQAEATLRKLAGELESAREAERRRLAKELHDTTCQELMVASLTVLSLKRQLGSDNADGRETLDELNQSLERAMRDLRALSYLFHTPTSSGSLADAARAMAVEFGKRAGLQVRFSTNYSGRSAECTERVLLTALREALMNVYRHSGSKMAHVALTSKDGSLTLAISDRGQWIESQEGVGLPSMRERVADIGGKLTVRQTPRGTRVSIAVPKTP